MSDSRNKKYTSKENDYEEGELKTKHRHSKNSSNRYGDYDYHKDNEDHKHYKNCRKTDRYSSSTSSSRSNSRSRSLNKRSNRYKRSSSKSYTKPRYTNKYRHSRSRSRSRSRKHNKRDSKYYKSHRNTSSRSRSRSSRSSSTVTIPNKNVVDKLVNNIDIGSIGSTITPSINSNMVNNYSTKNSYKHKNKNNLIDFIPKDRKERKDKDRKDKVKEDVFGDIEEDDDEEYDEEKKLLEARKRREELLNKFKRNKSTEMNKEENITDNITKLNHREQGGHVGQEERVGINLHNYNISHNSHTDTHSISHIKKKKSNDNLLPSPSHKHKLINQTKEDMVKNESAELLLRELDKEREEIMNEKINIDTDMQNNLNNLNNNMFVETPEDCLVENKEHIININSIDVYDDTKGYFVPKQNEILNSQYKVLSICGKGVFSNVLKVVDINSNVEYAIKMIRNLDNMIISGEKEKSLLKKLNEKDKNDKCNLIKLINSFEFKKHICMVFELYDMNLRDLIKTDGKGIGLSLECVRAYAKQILLALSLLSEVNLIHADFKPDNIVVSKSRKHVKLCDFGTALYTEETFITKYIQSRYYRAPEVMLGCPYDCKIDMWSLGCTLYELYTGKVLFQGRTNNEMIKLMMQIKGKFSAKMIKRGKFSDEFFTEQGEFLSQEIDPVTKKIYVKEVNVSGTPTKDLFSMLKAVSLNNAEETKSLSTFKDFLEKCLVLDPNKRFTAHEALCHNFINLAPNLNIIKR